jgi:hypothetical protein
MTGSRTDPYDVVDTTADDTATFLIALRRIAIATGDPAWLHQQTAGDLAQLSGLLLDQVMVLLPTVGVSLATAEPYVSLSPQQRAVGLQVAQCLLGDGAPVVPPDGRN